MTKIDELKALLAKWEAEEKAEGKAEGKPVIEPCPICSGEMEENGDGEVTHVGQFCCHYWGGYIESHNIIARVLKAAKRQVTTFPCDTSIQLKVAVIDLLKLQTDARRYK
jgi:hypothetical protein